MQDGDSIKGKDEAKRDTVEQAHLMPTHGSTYLQSATVNHARIQSKQRTKARKQCRATTEYNLHKHTYTILLDQTGATHTHLHKTQKK